MQHDTLLTAIRADLPDAEISLEGEGCSFTAVVASPAFAGLSQVKRQQLILASLNPWLRTGELHAITLRTYTPEELEQARAAQATGLIMPG